MSENTENVTEATEAEDNAPEVTLDNFEWESDGTNPAADVLVGQYVEAARAAKDDVNYIGKVKSPGDLVAEKRKEENSSDVTVRKFQEWEEKYLSAYEKAVADINAYIKDRYIGETNEEEVTRRKAHFKELRDRSNALVTVLEGLGVDDSQLPAFPTLRGTGGGTSSAGKGTRPRVDVIRLDGEVVLGPERTDKDGNKVRSSTFTALKQELAKHKENVETSDLQSRALEALGVSDWADAQGKDATFAVGKHTVSVTV